MSLFQLLFKEPFGKSGRVVNFSPDIMSASGKFRIFDIAAGCFERGDSAARAFDRNGGIAVAVEEPALGVFELTDFLVVCSAAQRDVSGNFVSASANEIARSVSAHRHTRNIQTGLVK